MKQWEREVTIKVTAAEALSIKDVIRYYAKRYDTKALRATDNDAIHQYRQVEAGWLKLANKVSDQIV